MVTSFHHNNDVTDRLAASVRLFVFYLSLGAGTVVLDRNKRTEIPIWCARKNYFKWVKTAGIWIWCARIQYIISKGGLTEDETA